MSLSGINFSGLGSGIDTESIIKQLSAIDQRPIQQIQTHQQQIQQQQTALAQISAVLTGLQSAAATLNGPGGFSLVKASVADETIAKITANTGAQTGTHSLTITQLAQNQKIGATPVASQTTPLGVSGQFVINGKAISVAGTDNLQAIAANINGAQAGVNASIVTASANAYTLILTSNNSGTANTISLSDVGSGTILQNTLGLINNTSAIRNPITNGAQSNLFKDSSTSIGSLLGLTSPPAGTIQINGTNVAIDLGTDSLTAIVGKINTAAIAGVTASIVSTTDPNDGSSKQELKIVGASTPTFTDANNVLANLGVVQHGNANQLLAGKDSKFNLDGIDIVRSSNTISDVISGVTLNLLKDASTPTTSFDVTTDVASIKNNIVTFTNQYNQLVQTVGNLSQFDPQTLAGGPLFGDVTTQNIVNSITDVLTSQVKGLSPATGTKTLLSDIGITLDKTNILNVSDSDLTAALNTNLSDVARIFRAAGVATDSSVAYVGSTDKSQGSTPAGYAINITQAATQATVTAPTQHTADNNPDSEILTFAGGQLPNSGLTVAINPNSTLDDMVAQINADKGVSPIVTAANVGGFLQLTAKQFGSSYSFTVHSSQSAAANNSGVGIDTLIATGLDVTGTINGESATGKGQFLTGNAGNANTDGLEIRISSTTTGSKGNITFTKGLAAQSFFFAQNASDPLTGSLTSYSNSLGEQVTEMSTQITDLQASVKDREDQLRQQFAAMEAAVVRLKSTQNSLTALAASVGTTTTA